MPRSRVITVLVMASALLAALVFGAAAVLGWVLARPLGVVAGLAALTNIGLISSPRSALGRRLALVFGASMLVASVGVGAWGFVTGLPWWLSLMPIVGAVLMVPEVLDLVTVPSAGKAAKVSDDEIEDEMPTPEPVLPEAEPARAEAAQHAFFAGLDNVTAPTAPTPDATDLAPGDPGVVPSPPRSALVDWPREGRATAQPATNPYARPAVTAQDEPVDQEEPEEPAPSAETAEAGVAEPETGKPEAGEPETGAPEAGEATGVEPETTDLEAPHLEASDLEASDLETTDPQLPVVPAAATEPSAPASDEPDPGEPDQPSGPTWADADDDDSDYDAVVTTATRGIPVVRDDDEDDDSEVEITGRHAIIDPDRNDPDDDEGYDIDDILDTAARGIPIVTDNPEDTGRHAFSLDELFADEDDNPDPPRGRRSF
ncbi:hypothetical protein [Enemella sp. A6]|uniref:hypothetical protein n=1 Tax=Enemella sp. A6 TaxID=3440152 RepID=UPI003EBF83C6